MKTEANGRSADKDTIGFRERHRRFEVSLAKLNRCEIENYNH